MSLKYEPASVPLHIIESEAVERRAGAPGERSTVAGAWPDGWWQPQPARTRAGCVTCPGMTAWLVPRGTFGPTKGAAWREQAPPGHPRRREFDGEGLGRAGPTQGELWREPCLRGGTESSETKVLVRECSACSRLRRSIIIARAHRRPDQTGSEHQRRDREVQYM